MVADSGKLPPRRPVTTILPPLARTLVAKASDFSEPTKSQAANTPPPVDLMNRAPGLAVGWIERYSSAGLECRVTLAGIDVGDGRRLGNNAFAIASPIIPTPPRPTSSAGPRARETAAA